MEAETGLQHQLIHLTVFIYNPNKEYASMKKMLCLSVLVSFALGLTFVSTGNSRAQADEPLQKIIISELRSEFWLPVYLADELGYFKEEGLEAEFVTYRDGPVALMGLLAGDSHFCMLSLEPVMRLYDQGKETTVIMSALQSKPYMFVTRKGIESVQDLKGKVVFAGMPGSAPYMFVQAVLESEGLDPGRDVQFASLEYGATLAALQRQAIDGAYISIVRRPEILAMGANIVVDVSDPAQHEKVYGSKVYESSIVTVTNEFVEEHSPVIQRFSNAVVKAIKWQNENSDEKIAEVARSYFPHMDASLIGILRPTLSTDGFISQEGFETINGFLKKANIISQPIPFENMVDMSFFEKAHGGLNHPTP